MITRSSLLALCLSLAVAALAPASAHAVSFTLDEVLFTTGDPASDRDGDRLKDALEFKLADRFKPFLRFDSAEGARRGDEPVTLFQVRPANCVGGGTYGSVNCGAPWRINIKYALLFERDGGYGPSSDCGDAHWGDNEDALVVLVSWDARTWYVESVNSGIWTWPNHGMGWYQTTHPIVFMSSHKHHEYFDTAYNEQDSVYSSWGCNDDVDGLGPQILPSLVAPDGRYNNVGEIEGHDPAYFVNDLAIYNYPGENAWSYKQFSGGHGTLNQTSSLIAMWFKNTLQVGSGINIYGLRFDAVFNGVPNNSEYVMTAWHYQDVVNTYYNQFYYYGWRLYSVKAVVFNGETLFDVVLRPSTTQEVWAATWSYDDFNWYNQYLFGQGWRLFQLQTVVIDGTLRYTAIWHPGSGGEQWVAGLDYASFQSKANTLFSQGWRLDSYQTYTLNGQTLFTAVWHPGTPGEYWIAGWPEASFRSQVSYFNSIGWRLKTFNTFYQNDSFFSALWKPGTWAEWWSSSLYPGFLSPFQSCHAPGGTCRVESLSSPN